MINERMKQLAGLPLNEGKVEFTEGELERVKGIWAIDAVKYENYREKTVKYVEIRTGEDSLQDSDEGAHYVVTFTNDGKYKAYGWYTPDMSDWESEEIKFGQSQGTFKGVGDIPKILAQYLKKAKPALKKTRKK